jgi:hypothetical protein
MLMTNIFSSIETEEILSTAEKVVKDSLITAKVMLKVITLAGRLAQYGFRADKILEQSLFGIENGKFKMAFKPEGYERS